jgi:L-iditol 2-dehydrogenase
MRAARLTAPKRFEFLDVETPVPEEGQCLIKVERVGICGSDIRRGYDHSFPEESYPLPVGFPCHECAGVIVESRCEEYKEGQRVIVLPFHLGGLVEYIAAPANRIIPLPEWGDLTDWLPCQPSGTVLYSCQRMGGVLGKRVAVIGQGGIGLSFTMILSRLGARVIALDLLEYRLSFSREVGATHTVNASRDNPLEAVLELTDGQGADIVVEAAGEPEAVNEAILLAKKEGLVILFGIMREERIPLDHARLMDKQLTLQPTASARTADPTRAIKEMVALRERGWIDPARLITHRLTFDEVQKAYDLYDKRQDNIIKVVMSL